MQPVSLSNLIPTLVRPTGLTTMTPNIAEPDAIHPTTGSRVYRSNARNQDYKQIGASPPVLPTARSFRCLAEVREKAIGNLPIVLSFTETKKKATYAVPPRTAATHAVTTNATTTHAAGPPAPRPYPTITDHPFPDADGDTEANAMHQPPAHTAKTGRLSPQSIETVGFPHSATPSPTPAIPSKHSYDRFPKDYERHKGRDKVNKPGLPLYA